MPNKKIDILLIEDNQSDVYFVERVLDKAELNYKLRTVDKREEYERELTNKKPDVILSDHSLPSFNSLDALRIARKSYQKIPFILVTGTVSEEFAVECMKAGVNDYILKNSLFRLPEAIKRAFESQKGSGNTQLQENDENTLNRALNEIKTRSTLQRFNLIYAQAVNESISPGKKQFLENFSETLLFSETLSDTSGNFYWTTTLKHKIVCVSGECPINNIAGTFLISVIYHIINNTINVDGITSPAQILNRFEHQMKSFYKRIPEPDLPARPIAISICIFDKSKKKAEFSGINASLMHIQHGIPALVEGTKMKSNAKSQSSKAIEQSIISVTTDDSFYFFPDTFFSFFDGGRHSDNILGTVMNIFDTLQEVNMDEQEKIFSGSFTEWKVGAGKSDNVLLLGVKL